jgi:outer membrane protein
MKATLNPPLSGRPDEVDGGKRSVNGRVGRRLLLAGMLWLCVLSGVRAQPSANGNLTLQQAIEYALKNSRNIKAATLSEKLSRAETREVVSTGLPQINAAGTVTNNLIIPTQLLPAEIIGGEAGTFIPVRFGTQYSTTAGVEATQLLYSQSYLVGLKAARVAEEYSQLSTRKAKEALAYDISLLFYGAQISGRQLEMLKENLESTRKVVGISDLQYQNGVLKKVVLDRLKVNQTNLETQIQNLETVHQQQLNTLKYLMGMPLQTVITVEQTIDENQARALVLNRDLNIFQNRTDYQLLNKTQELYTLQKKNHQAGYFPTLSGFASYNYQAFRQEFDFHKAGRPWFQTSAIGLRLSIPVFDGLARDSRIQQTKIKLAQTENQAEMLKESIQLDLINANSTLENSRKALATQEENQQLAQEVYQQTQLEYTQGFASLSDLLNSETELRQAQNSYLNALVDMLKAGLELRKVDGTLLTGIEME